PGRSGCSASGSSSPPSLPSCSGSSTVSGATCGSACRTSPRCRDTGDELALLGRRALVPGGERQGPPLVRGARARLRAADAARRADPGLLPAFAVDRPLLDLRHDRLARLHARARADASLRAGPARCTPRALGRRSRRLRDLPALGTVLRGTRPRLAPRLAPRPPLG